MEWIESKGCNGVFKDNSKLRRLPGKSLCDQCTAMHKKMQQGISTNVNDFVRKQIVKAKTQGQLQ